MGSVTPLPLQFAQCFSSEKGLAILHSQIQASVLENQELGLFLKTHANALRLYARDTLGALTLQHDAQGGFNRHEGGFLKRAYFSGVLAASHKDGVVQRKTALELEKLVAGFEKWQQDYSAAMSDAKDQVQAHLAALAKGVKEVQSLKQTYDHKCLDVEELEDETAFHQPPPPPPPLTIPKHAPKQKKSPGALMSPVPDPDDDDDEPLVKPIDAVLGPHRHPAARPMARKVSLADRLKALTRDASETALPSLPEDAAADDPSILEIAGIKNAHRAWSSIFSQADQALPIRTLKIPLIGTYDAHSGEDLVAWFRENLSPLEGDYLKAFEFCRQLSEELLVLRLVGEIGNRFSDSNDAYYQFRPEAFQLDTLGGGAKPDKPVEDNLTRLPAPASPRLRPQSPEAPKSPTQPASQALLKRSGTILSTISNAFTPAPPSVKLDKTRQEMQDAMQAYKAAVRRTELLRMRKDEQVENYLNFLQHAQFQRLQFIKTTLQRYHTLAAPIRPVAVVKETEVDEVQIMIGSIKPEADLEALCELYRVEAGYRSRPVLFHDHYGETSDALFGGDLVKWQEAQVHQGTKMEQVGVPPVLQTMLDYIREGYPKLTKDSDKRRIWYLEIPLATSHRLRQALNDARAGSANGVPTNFLKQSDIAVVASVVKLFFLDLENPAIPFSLYEHVRKLYSSLGSSEPEDSKLNGLKDLLAQVPKVHLLIVDALVSHIGDLMASTRSETDDKIDPDDVYLAKVGYALGRCLARPKEDTAVTISDRAPVYLFVDLVRYRDALLPSAIEERSKKEANRFRSPVRKRTRPVDLRISRSKLSESINAEQVQVLLEEQLHKKEPKPVALQAEPEEAVPEPTEAVAEEATLAVPSEKEADALEVPSNPTPEPPFATPEEELDRPLGQASSPIPQAVPLPDPVPVPEGQDPPFVPPAEPEDPPFVPPTEPEDPPFQPPSSPTKSSPSPPASGLNRSGSAGSLTRSARVSRGPRKLEESTPTGRVAAAAKRFSAGR